MGKTADALARIKAVALNCTSSHCILIAMHSQFLKNAVSLKYVLDEAVSVINFIESQPLSTHLFNVLRDTVEMLESTPAAYQSTALVSRESTCEVVNCKLNYLLFSFFLERMTD